MFRLMLRPQTLAIVNETSSRAITTSSVCFSEPLRKKKGNNPLTTKKQWERKVRRLEREINKIEAEKPKLKPVAELELDEELKQELDVRRREGDDEVGRKILNSYYKVWSVYKQLETAVETRHITECVRAQEKALEVLRNDYPELYMEAIKLDDQLIPFRIRTPKKETPPIESFSCPDGKETDITKKFTIERIRDEHWKI